MVYCFNFSAYIRFFVRVLIETNVNISNELNFSDGYRSINCIGSLAKFIEPRRSSCTLHVSQCSVHFDKPQKNEIHSLNVYKFCVQQVCMNGDFVSIRLVIRNTEEKTKVLIIKPWPWYIFF